MSTNQYTRLKSAPRRQNYNSFNGDSKNGGKSPVRDVLWQTPSVSPLRLFFSQLHIILPFVWPRGKLLLQLNVLLCALLIVAGRVGNFFTPIYSKLIVDALLKAGSMEEPEANSTASSIIFEDTETQNTLQIFPWSLVFIWAFLKVLQGGGAGTSGLIGNASNFLFLFIQQYTTRELENRFFEHINDLNIQWHYSKRTGMVLRALDRGTIGLTTILQYLIFNLLPALLDILVAIVYLLCFFNYQFGVVISLTMLLYLLFTFTLSNYRTKFNRRMLMYDNLKRQRAVDALAAIEAVKIFGNEGFEKERYADVNSQYQREELKFTVSASGLDVVQTTVIALGFLSGGLLGVWMVVARQDDFTVGSYVLFVTYIMQLLESLSSFGSFYRILLRRVIDLECMRDLFKVKNEVPDMPGAQELILKNAKIEFKNVSFGYTSKREILSNVSFTVHPGQTVAFVGPSGQGKTSIIRLICRYYDATSGKVLINGQDVKFIKQKSLRRHIGIVPQDTILFNDTIEYNIRYGRVTAPHNEVVAAAQTACIHEKIIALPDGYNTLVGERGMKLSGGEKQRVAIARTVLKNPQIVLLDEATSALDSHTERQIQDSLVALCSGRTSVVVAHRLSTITNADCIIVLASGRIAETGTHAELLAAGGVYAGMWRVQEKVDRSAESSEEEVDEVDDQVESIENG